jgi:serine/threonine protein kinase
MDAKRQILDKLLSGITAGERADLESLRVTLATTPLSDNELNIAKELVAQAHLACFNIDGRNIFFAIDLFYETRNWQALVDLLKLAKSYGNLNAVMRLLRIGEKENIQALTGWDFPSWLKEHGIFWFDIYADEKLSLAFVIPADLAIIKETICAHWTWAEFWKSVLTRIDETRHSPDRIGLLHKIAAGENPVIETNIPQRNLDSANFYNYCASRGIEIIRQMQTPSADDDTRSAVYLIRDRQGIFQVAKEVINYRRQPIGKNYVNEDKAYELTFDLGFLPTVYNCADIGGGQKFLFESFSYGQSLAEYLNPDRLLTPKSVYRVILEIAIMMKKLVGRRMLYPDLKPENILLNSNQVRLLDLGITKSLDSEQKETAIFLAGGKYAAPENGLSVTASEKSLVFQLGIMFYALLTGKHPFAGISIQERFESVEEENIAYLLPTMCCEAEMPEELSEEASLIISRLLKKNPQDRPTLTLLIDYLRLLNAQSVSFSLERRNEKNRKKNNIVLFPARMGLPHKGHIEYISRLIGLGYHVRISVQKSYTITQDDPIPKWLVMKIVAQSLLEKGFSRESFSFMLTPFYQTDREHRLHFVMMPKSESVIGIASNNPNVWELFPQHIAIDQNAVFGHPNQPVIDRSWGKILRTAVTQNDYPTFKMLAASGFESILPFEELQALYGKPAIEFVEGNVLVTLLGQQDEIIAQSKVSRYETPEEALTRKLNSIGRDCKLLDPFSRNSIVSLESQTRSFQFITTELADGNEIIYYRLI